MTPEVLVAAVLGAVLVLYVLTGGADFGGGLWDLLAFGPRQVEQRRAIANAIGPIWEANHVWVIVALVITFVAFPKAFSAISTALHVPLTLMLVGVVLRGSAFVFRAYAPRTDDVQRGFSWVFATSSTVTPVLLGMVVGAIASGQIRVVDGVVQTGFFASWLAPFPFVVGLLTLAIFGFLAAVYLTLDTRDAPALQEDFRLRGLWASGAVFVLAWLAFFLARHGAPRVWEGLWAAPWSLPLQLAVAGCGLGCIGALWARRFRLSRDLTVIQVVLVVGGWALSQYPMVVPPDLSVADSAPPNVLWTMLTVLTLGAVPLVPAYVWLMVVFKGR
ncbi:MAG: cytochrome d ubiquinol oxidase subunit II [Myxococcales bacterium]|nr:cytochrome d ubiquinol oxidase subunit II [Myxococcales bacterium]